ncbi:hypothetical protein LTR86_001562 [Recurvomyces mirabilis]|nr:hypothetical protein LTR86_001562 [Recurvomyces mirabilis]
MGDQHSHPPAPDIAILSDSIQVHTSSISAEQTSPEQSLLEPYARFRQDPLNALQELGLHLAGTEWRSYDRVIGQRIFYPGFSEEMTAMVMQQKKLRERVSDLAQKRVEVEIHEGLLGAKGLDGEEQEHRTRRLARRREIEEQLRGVAEKWTDQMICKMDSNWFIRSAYYIATQLLTRAYHQGIHVNSDEVLHLRSVAEEAAKKKQSIIFLPCHRSHVDYVSLQLICYRLGLALPTVVAGDNLNFPVIGPFLQHAGAMWIRRSFGDDQLYATLVQAYMDTLLQNGFNIECFVEGGRSRTGKLLQPKFGILSYFLESILSGSIEDAIICPVSTQYDKVIEVDSYVRELLGQPKPKEDLVSFLSASNVLSLKLGRVDVRFKEPWSLRGFIDQQRSRLHKQSASLQTMYDDALRRKLLTTLGYKVLKDINDVSVVMPTALVGTVLLTLRGRGIGKSELVRRVNWLRERVRAQDGRVAHFVGLETEAVVEKALEVLGPKLVGSVPDLPEPTYYAEDRFQLSFYRNMTIHLFISQALVCAAVYTKVKRGGHEQGQRVPYAELEDYVHFLSQLFRAEFIYPTEALSETLSSTITGLEKDEVLQRSQESSGREEVSYVELHPKERSDGRENFDFYCFMIWPFIEASWLGTISIFMLTPPQDYHDFEAWLDFKGFQDRAQLLGKTLYHQGDLSYFEAVNKEALKNAISRAEEEGIIVVKRSKDSKVPPRVRLDLEWLPPRSEAGKLLPDGRLWELCERISQSRREGKNRRDGATVKTRVLALAHSVGASLFDSAVSDAEGTGSKSKRRRGIQTRAQL